MPTVPGPGPSRAFQGLPGPCMESHRSSRAPGPPLSAGCSSGQAVAVRRAQTPVLWPVGPSQPQPSQTCLSRFIPLLSRKVCLRNSCLPICPCNAVHLCRYRSPFKTRAHAFFLTKTCLGLPSRAAPTQRNKAHAVHAGPVYNFNFSGTWIFLQLRAKK